MSSQILISFDDFLSTKPDIAEGTKEQYKIAVNKSYRECQFTTCGNCDCKDNLFWIEKHHEQLYEELKSRLTLSTLRTRTNVFKEISCQMGYRNAYIFFGKKHKELFTELKKQTLKQERTPRQEELKIDYNAFKAGMDTAYDIALKIIENDSITPSDYLLVQEAFIMCCYFDYPLRRDLADCVLFREPVGWIDTLPTDEKVNCIFKDCNGDFWLSLKCFKNVKSYGDVCYKLGERCGILLDWIMKSPVNTTDSVLINESLGAMNRDTFGRNTFTKLMMKYTGKPSRCNDWRSCVPSYIFNGSNPLAERQELARRMCHSVGTQMAHYEKH